MNSYQHSYRQNKTNSKILLPSLSFLSSPLYLFKLSSLSLSPFSPPSLSVSVESKPDLIFAEGVLDDLWNRNTVGSACVQLICETETDAGAEANKTQRAGRCVSATSHVQKERITLMSIRAKLLLSSATFSGKKMPDEEHGLKMSTCIGLLWFACNTSRAYSMLCSLIPLHPFGVICSEKCCSVQSGWH